MKCITVVGHVNRTLGIRSGVDVMHRVDSCIGLWTAAQLTDQVQWVLIQSRMKQRSLGHYLAEARNNIRE